MKLGKSSVDIFSSSDY